MNTTKILIAATLIILPALVLAGGNNTSTVSFAEHGTVHVGVEAGCWYFETDSGATHTMLGGNSSIYRESLTGILTGNPDVEIMTLCMQGPVVLVESFDADNQMSMVGVLEYRDVETGCWILRSGNKSFLTTSDDPSFFVDGAKVKVTGVPHYDVRTFCYVDGVIEVLSYNPVGGTPTAKASKPIDCHAQYAQCRKTCRDSYCLISCEDLLRMCMDNR